MHTHVFDFPIRVLLYREDGGMVAHSLEMDLVGFGRDEKSALSALREMVMAQISFACSQNDHALLFHSAPEEFFHRWERAHQKHLKSEIAGEGSANVEIRAAVICLTPEDLRKATAPHRFQEMPESTLAAT